MAFTVRLQKLYENNKRLVVKFVGIANAVEDESNVLKLSGATTNNSTTCLATRTVASVTQAANAFQISKIWANVTPYALSANRVQLKWASSTTTDTTGVIATFGGGETRLDLTSEMGGALISDNSVTGSITSLPGLMVSTTGFQAQMAYTIIVELKKSCFSTTTLGWEDSDASRMQSYIPPSTTEIE